MPLTASSAHEANTEQPLLQGQSTIDTCDALVWVLLHSCLSPLSATFFYLQTSYFLFPEMSIRAESDSRGFYSNQLGLSLCDRRDLSVRKSSQTRLILISNLPCCLLSQASIKLPLQSHPSHRPIVIEADLLASPCQRNSNQEVDSCHL